MRLLAEPRSAGSRSRRMLLWIVARRARPGRHGRRRSTPARATRSWSRRHRRDAHDRPLAARTRRAGTLGRRPAPTRSRRSRSSRYLMIIVLGASAVGAEYRAGTVTTILTWEPRRVRLLAARLGAVAIVSDRVLRPRARGLRRRVGARRRAGREHGGRRRRLLARARWSCSRGRRCSPAALAGDQRRRSRRSGATPRPRSGIWFGYLVAVEAILRRPGRRTSSPWLLTISAGGLLRLGAGRGRTSTRGRRGAGTFHLGLYVAGGRGRGARRFRPP